MGYLDYEKLEKYKIEEHDGGLSYSKRILVSNSDSKNNINTNYCFEDLPISHKFRVSDEDTLVISSFARASNDENIYGFFIGNLNNGDDSDVGLPISKKEFPCDDYDMYEYAAKFLATTLKNSGFKNIKVLVDFIMSPDECHKYIYACDMLGDEKRAIKQILESPMTLEVQEIRETDAFICFRPQDYSTILDNLDEVEKIICTGGPACGKYELKGFVYIDNDIEFKNNEGTEYYKSSRFATICNGKGLYLCIDASYQRRSFDYDEPLIQEVETLCKELNIEATVSYGGTMINSNGTFINKQDLEKIEKEILEDEVKYRANHDLASNKTLTDTFLNKDNLSYLTYPDVLIKSTPKGMIEMCNRIDEIHELLKDTVFFVKGFVYVNKTISTTGDYGFVPDEQYPDIHSYDIDEDTVYLCLGNKEDYYDVNYDIVYKIQDLIKHKCIFSVVLDLNRDPWNPEYENPDLINYIFFKDENDKKAFCESLLDSESKTTHKGNYMTAWDFAEVSYDLNGVMLFSKQIGRNKYLLCSFNQILGNIRYTTFDISQLTLDKYYYIIHKANKYLGYDFFLESSFNISRLKVEAINLYISMTTNGAMLWSVEEELECKIDDLPVLVDRDSIKSIKVNTEKRHICEFELREMLVDIEDAFEV